ncbi:MAG TPA: hdeD [Deltaproteobacteria bacterium]|nr:hdeD [Deltaproteobacteria bacterium]
MTHDLKHHWGWFLVLGIALVILGTMAIYASVYVTLLSMVFLGILLLIAAAFHLVGAFRGHEGGGFALNLLAFAVDVILGLLILRDPAASAAVITLLLAAFFLAGGIFRIFFALSDHLPNTVWVILNGLVNLGLGVLLILQWPYSGLWFIGLCIGIDMIFRGWSWVMLGFALRKIPQFAH